MFASIEYDGREFDATYAFSFSVYTFCTSETNTSLPYSIGVPELFGLFNFFLNLNLVLSSSVTKFGITPSLKVTVFLTGSTDSTKMVFSETMLVFDAIPTISTLSPFFILERSIGLPKVNTVPCLSVIKYDELVL